MAGEEKLIEDLYIFLKKRNEREAAATSFRKTKWRSCLIGWSHRLGVVMDGLSVAKWTMFWSVWAVDQPTVFDPSQDLLRCLTFVVHGIGQYQRAQQGVNSQFFKDQLSAD